MKKPKAKTGNFLHLPPVILAALLLTFIYGLLVWDDLLPGPTRLVKTVFFSGSPGVCTGNSCFAQNSFVPGQQIIKGGSSWQNSPGAYVIRSEAPDNQAENLPGLIAAVNDLLNQPTLSETPEADSWEQITEAPPAVPAEKSHKNYSNSAGAFPRFSNAGSGFALGMVDRVERSPRQPESPEEVTKKLKQIEAMVQKMITEVNNRGITY